MRSERQRDAVLAALREAWGLHPNQRLCQLIVNVTGCSDPFYVEDDRLIRAAYDYGVELSDG